jgi:hypothetical protein
LQQNGSKPYVLLHGMQGVSGSNPLGSIGKSQAQPGFFIALVSSQVPSQTR